MAPKKFNSTTETLDRLAASGQLSALMRKNTPLPPAQREMPLEDIVPDPEQPRRHFDGEQLASLSASIKAQGVLQAITVQPSGEDGKHRIIMGERRFQAAQRAGLKTIPVVIREMTAELRMAQLTENVQRADLTTLEIAEAVAAKRAAGQSRSAIAQANEGEVSDVRRGSICGRSSKGRLGHRPPSGLSFARRPTCRAADRGLGGRGETKVSARPNLGPGRVTAQLKAHA